MLMMDIVIYLAAVVTDIRIRRTIRQMIQKLWECQLVQDYWKMYSRWNRIFFCRWILILFIVGLIFLMHAVAEGLGLAMIVLLIDTLFWHSVWKITRREASI